jgi:hypothetical protein
MQFLFNVFLFFSFFAFALAADPSGPNGHDANVGQLLALLGPLLSAPSINVSGAASLPWQHTFSETITTTTFLFKTFLYHELPGLVTQCRGALHQNVHSIQVRIRKIAGADISWRAFLCADSDLDPENFDNASLVDWLCNHPGAVPLHTLDKDTTQSSIDFSLTPLLGLGTSVTYVLPPLRTPRIIIFASASTSLKDKTLVATVSGQVDIGGYGYVAGSVAPARAPAT